MIFLRVSINSRSSQKIALKIYDGRTSLIIVSSSLSIFIVIISVCVTFESQQGYSGAEFKRCSFKARKENSNSRLCVHVLFIICEMVISRRKFSENGKEMYRNNKLKHVKGVQRFYLCSLR